MQRFGGAVWLTIGGNSYFGSVISEDDHGRSAKGFRNRWRYTVTGPVAAPLPRSCELRAVVVRAQLGGSIRITFDAAFEMLIVPGDPELQARVARNAPVCEFNLQFVNVATVAGRWQIMIEEPSWLPETRTFCDR